MRPLPLAFPTASWSSYHPSDLENSYDDVSSKSYQFGSYSHSYESPSQGSSESSQTATFPRLATALSLPASVAPDTCWPEGSRTQLKVRRSFWKSPKPWKCAGGRERRNTTRANALLYLALTEPALSTSALLVTQQRNPRSIAPPPVKSKEASNSNAFSLFSLLCFACIMVFLSLALGIAVGCALVRSRPSMGAVTLAVLPLSSLEASVVQESQDIFGANGMSASASGDAAVHTTDSEAASKQGQPEQLTEMRPSTSDSDPQKNVSNGLATFVLEVLHTQPKAHEPFAVLSGGFRLLLSLYNQSAFGGTESGVSILEYIPAPLAGIRPEDACFTPYSTGFDKVLPTSQTADPEASLVAGEEFEGTGKRHELEGDLASPFTVKPLDAVATTATAPGGMASLEHLGPPFEALPDLQDLVGGSMVASFRRSPDHTLQELLHVSAGESAKMLMIRGSFLPLHGNSIVAHTLAQLSSGSNPNEPGNAEAQTPGARPLPPRTLSMAADGSRGHPVRGRGGFEGEANEVQMTIPDGDDIDGRRNDQRATTLGLSSTASSEKPLGSPCMLGSNLNCSSQQAYKGPDDASSTGTKGPHLLAVAFHPVVDAQAEDLSSTVKREAEDVKQNTSQHES
ncbi:hypothetical protein cyc_05445 [Cyclospora cayetanensis]|uniref:Transmembrane protein n=1 Tax=Cyclospora cayetanensis TaxID=88456 RepID=A0A1D3CXI8_9EIME|nr:hypothetical protein cyc_05445 [Cyclospora cayetanensis]